MNQSTLGAVVIFGATGGVGSILAHTLVSKATGPIVLVGREQTTLQKLRDELLQHAEGCVIDTVIANLENEHETIAACTLITKKHPVIDWVVYAAGHINEEEESKGLFLKTFLVNSFSVFTSHRLLKENVTSTGGCIFISSTAAQKGNGKFPFYAASKAALNTYVLSESKRIMHEQLSGRVVLITIGPTNTPMREQVAGDAASHQSPQIVANTISDIMSGSIEAPNGTHVRIENETVTVEL